MNKESNLLPLTPTHIQLKHIKKHKSYMAEYYKCNSVETAQPGEQTTNPGIMMSER